MASFEIAKPAQFVVSSDLTTAGARFKDWIRNIELYFVAAGITNESQKVALLLYSGGSEVQNIHKSLDVAADANYATVKQALVKYFEPYQNVQYERFSFFQANQEPNEGLDIFVTRLKTLSKSCQFDKIKNGDDLILSMIISKCRSQELRKRLLQEKNLDLNRALNIARSIESANKHSQAIEACSQNAQAVNKISNFRNSGNKKNEKSNSRRDFKTPQNPDRSKKSDNKQQTRCYRCGRTDHLGSHLNKCPAQGQICSKCNRIGHFGPHCRAGKYARQVHSSTGDVSQANSNSHNDDSENSDGNANTNENSGDFTFKVIKVANVNSSKKRKIVSVKVNGKLVQMQLDTGSDVSILPENIASTIPNIQMKPYEYILKDYNHQIIDVKGVADVNLECNGKFFKKMSIIIVKGQKSALLGTDWLDVIKPGWEKIFEVGLTTIENKKEILDSLLDEYKDVFQGTVGTVKNVQASLALKDDATPKFFAPRQIPFALKASVEQEIKRLEEEGIWEKVTYSNWGTPLVPIAKPQGGVRICGDYKVTLNSQLQVAQHPLPNPSHMTSTLENCKIFTKIDLKQAFQQLEMDEKSQDLCTLSTHLGLYRPKRLPYGVASSPAIWQQTMDKIFCGMEGIFCFVDDILIAGKDVQEHLQRLKNVLNRIKENGITINKEKCLFLVNSLEYLGFVLDGNGIHKTQDKVRAVKEAKVPENVKQLQSFLGLVTFYGKFIKDLATIAHPLYQLLNKEATWNWSTQCQDAFDKIKAEVTSPKFLVHFNQSLPVKLVCDASQVGIGAVIAHVMPDGSERPIAYASRILNKAESNYSQIEKEGLALVYGVRKFHIYLYGRKNFTLVTDHKPLLNILGPKSGLPTIVAARLQRWAIILAAYNYTLEYRSTKMMGNADALSRLPVDVAPEEFESNILLVESQNTPIKASQVAKETKKDATLNKILQSVISGRESLLNTTNEKPFKAIFHELSVERDCLLRGARVVIPQSLRQLVLKSIHEEHQGIVRSKAIARSFVWWPNIDGDIENFVKNCKNCSENQNNPKPVKHHPWESPRYPWQRLHVDFAGPFLGHSYLIVVDAYSKWPEVVPMNTTTSRCTIKILMQLIATHGLPERIVTDNGPQFTSEEFKNFLNSNGIHHTLSAPYHPSTNGEAERFVQTFKQSMRCYNATSENVSSCINKYLLSYRSTPHATTGASPSFLLMGRRLRNKLDLIKPDYISDLEHQNFQKLEKIKIRSFPESAPVMVRRYNTPRKWMAGKVIKKLGNLHYHVEVDGKICKFHIDQLKPGTDSHEHSEFEKEEFKNSVEISNEPSYHKIKPVPTTSSVLPLRTTRGKPPNRLDL